MRQWIAFSFYLCANYFRVHDVANSDDANRQHCDDGGEDGLRLLLPLINPFGPCMRHFRFLNVLRALRVSYFPNVRPKMLDYCVVVVAAAGALGQMPLQPPPLQPPPLLPVAFAIAVVVDPVFVVAVVHFVVIAPSAQLSDVDYDESVNAYANANVNDDDEAPEIQEIGFVDSNATMVADSNAECLSALFCI